MGVTSSKSVLFIGAKNDSRSRLAVLHFNSVAGKLGLLWQAASRGLEELTREELEQSHRVVALNEAEHSSIRQRFDDWPGRVECWQVENTPEMQETVEREVADLVARIVSGGEHQNRPPGSIPDTIRANATPQLKEPVLVKVGRETAGRRGKGVTTVFDTKLSPSALQELATILKQRCGTGGTVKDGRIEIQGDQRERIVAELEKLGYGVKRAGG